MLIKYKQALLYIFILIIIFIMTIGKIYPDLISLFKIEKGIGEKSTQVTDLERKLATLKATEAEKQTLNGQSKKIYKPEIAGIDAESSFTVIFDDIIDMAKYNGIKVYSVEYAYNPPEDEFVKGAAAKYNVCKVNMEIIADYPDLESFLKEIYKYPYLINIDTVEVAPYPKNKKILLTVLEMRLYASK